MTSFKIASKDENKMTLPKILPIGLGLAIFSNWPFLVKKYSEIIKPSKIEKLTDD